MSRNIEKYAEDYLEDKFEFMMSKYRKEMLKHFLDKYKPKNIIDIGPAYNYVFNDYKGFDSYIIIEPSSIMCEKIKPVKGVEIINDYFENVADRFYNKVDFVIASGLIHEIEDPDFFIKKIHSICNKHTILHISAPNNKSFHMLYAKEAGLIKNLGTIRDYSKKMQRLRTYDMNSLSKFIQDNGFKIIEKGPFFFKFFNQKKMQFCVDNEILTDNLLNALNKIAYILPDFSAEIWINGKIK